MSHIVIDAREYTTSTGRYMFRLLQYLDNLQSDHDFTILLKPKDMAVYAFTNPRFSKVACPHKEFTFGEQLAFKKQLNALHPDLVHFGKDHQPILYTGKVVTTMHDLTTARFRNPAKHWAVFKFKQIVYKQVVKIVAKKSVAVFTPTQFVKNDLIHYTRVPAEKITVTYESADAISDDPEIVPGLESSQFLMYVGRPTPHKNLGRLIDAFALLKKEHPDLKLVLAGKKDPLYEAHEKVAHEKGIPGIVFTGFVSEGQLRWLYENCSAYVFPSLSEGFGLPGLEAMIHGAPVVSSDATCLPEVYGDAAHYFNPLNTVDIATKINEVLTNAQLHDNLINASKTQVQQYSWKRMAEQTLAVYNKTLNH